MTNPLSNNVSDDLVEKSLSDAPAHFYRADEASAWASGWNNAAEQFRAKLAAAEAAERDANNVADKAAALSRESALRQNAAVTRYEEAEARLEIATKALEAIRKLIGKQRPDEIEDTLLYGLLEMEKLCREALHSLKPDRGKDRKNSFMSLPPGPPFSAT